MKYLLKYKNQENSKKCDKKHFNFDLKLKILFNIN